MRVTYTLEPVEQTPYQAAVGTYQFICADLAEGLEYRMGVDLYNKSMEGIGSDKRVTEADDPSAREFAKTFYEEWKRLHGDKS